MKARVDFTVQAAADLREIGRYTKETWGLAQARHYRQELELAFQKLGLAPEAGRLREEIALKVRSFKVAQHIAFHVPRRGGITILRVLHPGRDVQAALEQHR